MKQLEIMLLGKEYYIFQPTVHNNGQSMATKGNNVLVDPTIKTHWDMELIEIGIGRDNLSILRAVGDALLSRRHRIVWWIK